MICFNLKHNESISVIFKFASELKRKSSDSDFGPQSLSKKIRLDSENAAVSPVQSEIECPSSNRHLTANCPSSSPLPSSPFTCSSLESNSSSQSCSSSSSSSSSEGGQDDEASVEDEEYMPRRRGPQMWSSRQKWKDERKKVLKMSMNKLAEIDDPELCLLRSVLLNNTIKKLHLDIRNERQAKLRHRQQRIDFFAERFPPFSSARMDDSSSSDSFTLDFSQSGSGGSHYNSDSNKPNSNATTNSSVDFHDDSSCDEMFGINEDFLRVSIPDRRVSSPIPTTGQSPTTNSSKDTAVEPMDSSPSTTNCCSNASCDTDVAFRTTTNHSSSHQTVNSATVSSPQAFPQATTTPHNNNRRPSGSVVSSLSNNGGTQCAMQYRTNRDLGSEVSFPPRVPILDSVVYHSLLASLESS